jgi:hypothetical protein
MRLFSRIDEEKKERECSRRHRTLFDRQCIDLAKELLERERVALAVAPRTRGNAQPFHDLECLLPLETLDYAPQRTGKPPDVLVKWQVLRPRLHATPAAL